MQLLYHEAVAYTVYILIFVNVFTRLQAPVVETFGQKGATTTKKREEKNVLRIFRSLTIWDNLTWKTWNGYKIYQVIKLSPTLESIPAGVLVVRKEIDWFPFYIDFIKILNLFYYPVIVCVIGEKTVSVKVLFMYTTMQSAK